MAKMITKMGKVTWTDSNGQVIEFEPSNIETSHQTSDSYFCSGSAMALTIPNSNNYVDIIIEGTYKDGIFQADNTKWCGSDKVDWKHDYAIWTAKEIKETLKMKINMQWLKLNQLQNNDFGPGMLFLYENRSSIFGSEKEVVDNLTVMIINGVLPHTIDLSEYVGGLLVTGFDVPRAGHPLINTLLKPAIHHRGTVAQNNPRTIYEYMSDETYGLGLYVGLTVHDALGSWSSWPVHEYEINALTAPIGLYPDFSEKFAFITQPMGNWGLQARSQANGDKNIMKFRDGDIIDIPLGAHPSVAGPATRLAYFWAYCGAPRKDF